MVTEELYRDEKEVVKLVSIMCANGANGVLKDRDIRFNVRLKEVKNDQVYFTSVESSNPTVTLDTFNMRPLDGEINMGGNVYLFNAIPMSGKSISLPEEIRSHPKRKNIRIKVSGNSFISKMYAIVSLKVVDPTIQDEELSKKIHLIMNTIESTLVRSENYDLAKISLFDGTEKSTVIKIIKKLEKPFVVFDTANLSIKDESVLTYEDYVRFLSEERADYKNILEQLDKIKEFYQKNKIKSEAIVPLIFEEEVIGQIRVVSMKAAINKPNVMRLNNLALNAVDNLFTKCAFEVVSKEPQTIIDLATAGAKFMITDPDFYKYIRLMRRMYLQLNFPDETIIKTMATIVNIYDDTVEGYKVIGLKFSLNMDWKDKNKLDEFIQSVVRLQNSELIVS
jgi:hypothetical protein